MRIDCLPTPGRKSQMTIYLDGDEWRELHIAIFGRSPSLPKGCQTIEEFTQQFHALEYRLAKLYATKRLSMQSLLSTSLARSLRERLVSEVAIGCLIEEFAALGYLNDAEWTSSFVRQQIARKQGPRAIAYKLAGKGVAKEQVESALNGTCDVAQQKISIARLLATRYRQRNLTDYRERQKVLAALVRRGFDFDVILDCIEI